MDTEIKSKRGGWGSNFGFLMASIGSAVGLGNIWGFPYKMGKSGGAVFLLLYLVLVVLVGVTVMLGELALGRRSGKSAVSTYRSLSKKYTWLGYAGIVCGFCIMCFYFVLGGIVLRYAAGYFLAIFGGSEFAWSGQGTGFFGYFLTDTNSMILFFVLYILLNILVVSGGVQGGIEKFCNVGMPALFCLLVFIILYIACQPGAAEGYKFMFSPDFSVFSNPDIGFGRVLKSAAGQMFFSLSIGLGVMMTYGSYLGKQEHLQRNALIVCCADTLIALMAGMAVMPACSAFGVEYGAGPGLLFASMQTVFAHMGSVGNFIGFIFYLLVLIAALTSSISMLELCTAYAVDKQLDKGLTPKRAKHTASVAALVFVAGSLVALDGLGAGVAGGAAVETPATLFGLSVHGWTDCWLDLYDMVAEGILMPLGALVMTILIGWVLKPEVVQLECEQSGVKYRAAGYFKVCFKFIVPVLLAFILFCQLIDFFGLKIPGLS